MSQALNSLIDMGCSPILSQAAIKNLKTEDLSALLDWISDHSSEEEKWTKWLQQNENSQTGQKIEEVEGQGQTISHLVKKQIVDQLMKKGNSKNVAEKALLMSGNTTIENAQKWIDDHRYDADFEEQLFLQGNAFQESKLTDEEARQKLKELTDKAREIRKKREEEEERERERNRVRYGKEMVEAKRIAEEQAMKRQLELDKIQKRRDQQYKQQLLQQMRRQKQQKLGKKLPQTSSSTTTTSQSHQAPQKKLSKLEQVQLQCQQVVVGMHAYPDRAKTFFDTANIYISNIIKNNGDQKTRKINKSNKAFQERIATCFGGVEILEVIGFGEEDGFLVMKQFDLGELAHVAKLLQKFSAQY